MRSVILFFFSITSTSLSTSSKWFRFESKCFQTDSQKVTQPKAMEICRQRRAVLTSILDQKELDFIGSFLNSSQQYWVWASRENQDFQWGDGRKCCPQSWWAPNEPGSSETCARLRQYNGVFQLWGIQCSYSVGFICSKAVWTLVNNTDYYFDELCGVEIMPNCKGQRMCANPITTATNLQKYETCVSI